MVQVIRESDGDLVHAIRIKGQSFRAKVFEAGSYTLRIGEGPTAKELKSLKPQPEGEDTVMEVKF